MHSNVSVLTILRPVKNTVNLPVDTALLHRVLKAAKNTKSNFAYKYHSLYKTITK